MKIAIVVDRADVDFVGVTKEQAAGVSVVRFSGEVPVGVFLTGSCTFCGVTTPPPDRPALVFVLQHHDGQRLLAADAEDCYPERDRWPVTGWKSVDGTLACGCCSAKYREGQLQLLASLRNSVR